MRPGWAGSINMRWSTPQGSMSLADLRSYQDWYLRLLPEVGSRCCRGGADRWLHPAVQVNVDPNRLQAYGIPVSRVVEAVRGGNQRGGRTTARVWRHASTWCAAEVMRAPLEDFEQYCAASAGR